MLDSIMHVLCFMYACMPINYVYNMFNQMAFRDLFAINK